MNMEANQTVSTPSNTPTCPICQSQTVREVLKVSEVPILANVLWDTREAAISSPTGDVSLGFCTTCGHLYNTAFDPRTMEYDVTYENSLHFSPTFQAYADALAKRLIRQYDLHGKTIVEIGSGKGDFLKMLCDYGGNRGTGFDPSYDETADEKHPAITFIKDLYTEKYAHFQADLICSRHTLEHIFHPSEFAQNLRAVIGDRKNTVVYIEVPNLGFILRDTAIWDIIYEHVSYFGDHSLSYLMKRYGFEILDLSEVYDGQFLSIEARLKDDCNPIQEPSPTISLEQLTHQINQFAEKSSQKLAYWEKMVRQIQETGKRAALWGAGSKGISFLNMLHIQDEIPYVVDINPRKRNKYITGSGQQIIPPDFLREYQPHTVIIMNPIYKQEIQNTLLQMGLDVEILCAG